MHAEAVNRACIKFKPCIKRARREVKISVYKAHNNITIIMHMHAFYKHDLTTNNPKTHAIFNVAYRAAQVPRARWEGQGTRLDSTLGVAWGRARLHHAPNH